MYTLHFLNWLMWCTRAVLFIGKQIMSRFANRPSMSPLSLRTRTDRHTHRLWASNTHGRMSRAKHAAEYCMNTFQNKQPFPSACWWKKSIVTRIRYSLHALGPSFVADAGTDIWKNQMRVNREGRPRYATVLGCTSKCSGLPEEISLLDYSGLIINRGVGWGAGQVPGPAQLAQHVLQLTRGI